uniref:Uncharacterized protein n=1 Tax=Acrobeloides nanus TaxID=290746 RepID=A0A914CTE0_9BILA
MKRIVFVILLAVYPIIRAQTTIETEEDPLYLSWQDFTRVHVNQTTEFERDYPVDDRLYGNLKKCGRYNFGGETLSNNLQPSEIQIYAEIGNLATFCRNELTLPALYNETFNLNEVVAEFSPMCLQSMESDSQQPSLSKILRILSSNFEVVESKQRHKSLQVWTKHIVQKIHKIDRFLEKWKLIIIAPGIYDLEPGESAHRVVHDVLQSLQIIHHRLPEKTFVIILRNAKRQFWKALAKNFVFCEKILSLWPNHEGKSDEVWDVLEERVKKNYRSETFYVDVLPFLEDAVPLKYGKT